MGYLIGIDYGKKRIGIAVSDAGKKIAFPLAVVERKGSGVLNEIKRAIGDREVEAFIVGLPLRTDGKLSKMEESVINFSRELNKYFGVEVIKWDERYTSVIARNVLNINNVKRKKQKEVIDKISAQIILQSYLDYLNKNL